MLRSPTDGRVQLASGSNPAVVAAGDVVATVLSRGRTVAVRAPSRGYFVPALDGAENEWSYSSLWLGDSPLQDAPEPEYVEDLSSVHKDEAIGKLIELPQSPRAVFYANLTDAVSQDLDRGQISIRRISHGPVWTAAVRVFKKLGANRVKVVIDMPAFPLDMTLSRSIQFLVCSDEDSGLIVPESAVTLRNGVLGVFELVSDQLVFREVTGKPIKDGMFFVSSGLSPGNPVILEAAEAEEKRVRLW